MRVLIAEDDPTSLLLLKSFLSKYGKCDVAENGKQAVESFREALKGGKSYDLVCLDIMMPEMDGQTAIREIRAMEERLGKLSTESAKIIMITILDDAKNVMQSFHSLCDAYLFKPIDTRKLLAYITELRLLEKDGQAQQAVAAK